MHAAVPWDDVGSALTLARQARRSERFGARRAVAAWALGSASWWTGDLDGAAHALADALHGPLIVRCAAQAVLSRIELERGRQDAALALARAADRTLRERGLTHVRELGLVATALGAAEAERSAGSAALAQLERGVRLRRSWGHPLETADALVAAAPTAALVVGRRQAAAMLGEARRLVAGSTDPGVLVERLARAERHALPRPDRLQPNPVLSERELAVLRLLVGRPLEARDRRRAHSLLQHRAQPHAGDLPQARRLVSPRGRPQGAAAGRWLGAGVTQRRGGRYPLAARSRLGRASRSERNFASDLTRGRRRDVENARLGRRTSVDQRAGRRTTGRFRPWARELAADREVGEAYHPSRLAARRPTRSELAVGAAAIVAAGAAAAVVLAGGIASSPDGYAFVLALTVLVFVLAGLAWRRARPWSPYGFALIAYGLLASLYSLGTVQQPWVHSIGVLLEIPGSFFVFWLILAFPSGRLDQAGTRGGCVRRRRAARRLPARDLPGVVADEDGTAGALRRGVSGESAADRRPRFSGDRSSGTSTRSAMCSSTR